MVKCLLFDQKIDLLKEYRSGEMRIICTKSKETSLVCPYDYDTGMYEDYYMFAADGVFIYNDPPCSTCNLKAFRSTRLQYEGMIYACWKGILVREEDQSSSISTREEK